MTISQQYSKVDPLTLHSLSVPSLFRHSASPLLI
jgi:hypothetical protein